MTDGAGALEAELDERLQAAAARSRVNPEAAHGELSEIIVLSDGAGLAAIGAGARYVLARVLLSLGRLTAALGLIEAAERRWRLIGAHDEALRTNLGRMNVLDELGRHADAAEIGRSMLRQLDDADDNNETAWLRAAAQENLGVALGCLGLHTEALASYDLASARYAELGLDADATRALANRGVELTALGRSGEAIAAHEAAMSAFDAGGDPLSKARSATNLSESWISAGRYLEAFQSLDAADAALAGLDRTTDWLRAQLGRARCLASLHLDIEALDLLDELVDPMVEAGMLDELGEVQLTRGVVLTRSGARDEAQLALSAANAAFDATGDTMMWARAQLATARVGDDPGRSIQRAIETLTSGERPAELAQAHLDAASHHEATDPTRATLALAEASRLIDRVDVPALRWQLHHRRGRLLWRSGEVDDARHEFERAVSSLDSIRSSLDRDGMRQRFDGGHGEAEDDLVRLLLGTDEIDTAFATSDALRSRGLARRMRSEGAEHAPAADDLTSTYDRLLGARGPLVDELTSRARQLERQATPVTSAALDDLGPPSLGPNRILYHCLGEMVVAFVADSDGTIISVQKLGEPGEIVGLLRQLDTQWRRFAHRDIVQRHAVRMEAATLAVLRRLHELLMVPIAQHLDPVAGLVVVPDGVLGSVPFGCLHDGEAFLVDHQAVRQTPSVAIDTLLASRSRPTASLLAIGTEDDNAPLAAAEAADVGAMWPSATIETGGAATSQVLLDQIGSHDVVHIAGHGLFRPDAPEFSALRLADRWVTAAEISRLRLDGQLVVLSACDSGRRSTDGTARDAQGLPRAFLAAGASGVIVNLWPADDTATARLMSTLHGRLADGVAASSALRTAQLAVRDEHRHPYYWGGATLIGCPDDTTDPPPHTHTRSHIR